MKRENEKDDTSPSSAKRRCRILIRQMADLSTNKNILRPVKTYHTKYEVEPIEMLPFESVGCQFTGADSLIEYSPTLERDAERKYEHELFGFRRPHPDSIWELSWTKSKDD
jgi:hypothetical protein